MKVTFFSNPASSMPCCSLIFSGYARVKSNKNDKSAEQIRRMQQQFETERLFEGVRKITVDWEANIQ